MGKNQRREAIGVCMCVSVNAYVCVYVWAGSGWAERRWCWGILQCVKETEIGGKCVKGPYPSVLHIFEGAAVGAWLTDEWGVQR